MKIAICMSGLYRGNLDRNLPLFKKHFPTADFFFSTWEGREGPPVDNVYYHPEPQTHYHPVIDTVKECDAPKFKCYKAEGRNGTGQRNYNRTIHHAKQLVAHAYLLNEIPDDYDMILRTRYDTVLSPEVDFTPWLEISYNEGRAIGFGNRNIRHPNFNILTRIPEIYPADIADKSISHDWGWFIMDPLIFHRRDMFDTNEVVKMYNDKELWAAEWGWYQILSKPYGDNHISVYGGAQIEKYYDEMIRNQHRIAK